MTVRKPAGVSWESWADRQIREAQERGDFDRLAGAGQPIADLAQPYDELWWVRRKLKDEGLTSVPPSLQLRKAVEDAREAIARAETEDDVRRILADINPRIRRANRTGIPGPSVAVAPFDEEAVLARWRARRPDR